MIMPEQVMEAAGFIASFYKKNIKAALVIGTGLSGLTDNITDQIIIPYHTVPGFPVSSVPFHAARFIIGELNGTSVIVMDGRYHYYEGLSMQSLTLPIRVLHQLGVHSLVLTNAASSLIEEIQPGDLAVIKDHINLMGDNPLRGLPAEFGCERFIDMSEPYNRQWIETTKIAASNEHIALRECVYAAISGPSLLTPAEVNVLRYIGADIAGMSTVPEVLVARQLGIKVLALSAITDSSIPGQYGKINKKAVARIAQECVPRLKKLLTTIISALDEL